MNEDAKKPSKFWTRVRQSKKNRKAFLKWKSTLSCAICKEDHPACLEFHHLDPSMKDYNISDITDKPMSFILKEVRKCVVLCANCHRKLHNPR